MNLRLKVEDLRNRCIPQIRCIDTTKLCGEYLVNREIMTRKQFETRKETRSLKVVINPQQNMVYAYFFFSYEFQWHRFKNAILYFDINRDFELSHIDLQCKFFQTIQFSESSQRLMVMTKESQYQIKGRLYLLQYSQTEKQIEHVILKVLEINKSVLDFHFVRDFIMYKFLVRSEYRFAKLSIIEHLKIPKIKSEQYSDFKGSLQDENSLEFYYAFGRSIWFKEICINSNMPNHMNRFTHFFRSGRRGFRSCFIDWDSNEADLFQVFAKINLLLKTSKSNILLAIDLRSLKRKTLTLLCYKTWGNKALLRLKRLQKKNIANLQKIILKGCSFSEISLKGFQQYSRIGGDKMVGIIKDPRNKEGQKECKEKYIIFQILEYNVVPLKIIVVNNSISKFQKRCFSENVLYDGNNWMYYFPSKLKPKLPNIHLQY